MLFLSQSATVYGIDALIVDIEVNLQPVPKETEQPTMFTTNVLHGNVECVVISRSAP